MTDVHTVATHPLTGCSSRSSMSASTLLQAGKLYHMVELARWRACQAAQEKYVPPTYKQDGFIHLTSDPKMLLAVANHFYTAAPGDWVVLVIDPTKLSACVKFEPAAPVGNKASSGLLAGQSTEQLQDVPLFPHLYGPLELEAVMAELRMRRGADGIFLSIEGL